MAADRVTEARVTCVYWPRKKTSTPDCSSFADVERRTYLLRELNLSSFLLLPPPLPHPSLYRGNDKNEKEGRRPLWNASFDIVARRVLHAAEYEILRFN